MTGVALVSAAAAASERDGGLADERPTSVRHLNGCDPLRGTTDAIADVEVPSSSSYDDRQLLLRPQRGRHLDRRSMWSTHKSDSTYSWNSSISSTSEAAAPSWQRQLTDQCRMLRKRRQYDKLIGWCIREGVADAHLLQQTLDSSIAGCKAQASPTSCDVESVRSFSDMASVCHDLLADIVNDAVTSDDSDVDEADDALERIPARFRPGYSPNGSVNVDRASAAWPFDVAMTTAAELFWFGQQIQRQRRHTSYVARESPPPPSMRHRNSLIPCGAAMTSTARMLTSAVSRRSWIATRQMAVSEDFLDGSRGPRVAFNADRRMQTLPPFDSVPATDDERPVVVDDAVDSYDVDGVSESDSDDGTGSSIGDQASTAVDGGGDASVLRSQLQGLMKLYKAGVPTHFWPQLNSEIGRRVYGNVDHSQ